MDSNNEIKKIILKIVYDGINKIEYFDPDYNLIDENILVYNISYKSLIDSKTLRIILNKIEGFIIVYELEPEYHLLEKYDSI